MKNLEKNRIIMKQSAVIGFIFAVIYLFWHQSVGNSYILQLRGTKLLTYAVISASTAFATVSFQTIVHSNFLTPSILGIESFYKLLQTVLLFFSFSLLDKQLGAEWQFVSLLLLMLGSYFLIYRLSWGRRAYDMQVVLMIGLVLGTFFNSISSFFQVLMDPNEYDKLQTKLFASFQNINDSVLLLAIPLALLSIQQLWAKRKVMEVLSLGTQTAKNLGVDADKEIKTVFMHVIILSTVSAALVGPMIFLGFVARTSPIACSGHIAWMIFFLVLV